MILPQGNRKTGLVGFTRLLGILCLIACFYPWSEIKAQQVKFNSDNTVVCEGETVTFHNNTEAPIDSCYWIFGPGAVPEDTILMNKNDVTVAYQSAGKDTVTLKIWNTGTENTLIKPDYITVNPVPGKPQILGDVVVCPFSEDVIYNVSDPDSLYHSYDWSVSGGFKVEDFGTNWIKVFWLSGPSGNLEVSESIDSSGCQASSDVLPIQIEDATPPDANCKDTTVYLDGSGKALIDSTFIDDGITDNCGDIKSITLGKTNFSCGEVGLNPITVMVKDESGNIAFCSAGITVLDTISPIPDLISSLNVYLNPSGVAAVNGSDFDNGSTADNCSFSITSNPNNFDCGDIGDNTVLVTVSDINGNSVHRQVTVTVRDTIKPLVNPPSDYSLEGCDVTAISDLAYNEAETPVSLAAFLSLTGASASDNCGIATITYQDSQSGNCPLTVTRIFRITDDNGNLTTKSQIIHVDDTIAPTVTPPSDYNLEGCNISAITDFPYSETETVITLPEFLALPGAGVTENCHIASVTYQDTRSGTCPVEVRRTFRLSDDCGNTTSVIQTIRVNDTTAPVVIAPSDYDIQGCDISEITGLLYSESETAITLPVFLSLTGASASDNCSIANISYHDSKSGTCPVEVSRIFKIKDGCNNQTVDTQIIRIKDTTPPVFTTPPDDTICRSLDCSFDTDPSITGNISSVSDNCTSLPDISYSDDLANLSDCDHFGYITRKWSVKDSCNNITVKDQIIYIEPVPKVQLIPDSALYCNNEVTAIEITSSTVPDQPLKFRYQYIPDFGDSINITLNSPDQSDLPEGFMIEDNIQNTGSEVHKVILIVTPYTLDNNGSERCTGINDTSTIWINPTPVLSVSSDSRLCSNDSVSFDINRLNGMVSEGWFYDVSVSYPDGVSGDWTGGLSSLNLTGPAVLTDHLMNTGDSVKTLTYSFTPFIRLGNGNDECRNGIAEVLNIEINPRPRIEVSVDDTLCYDGTADITITNPTNQTGEWRYDLDVTYPAGVTGTLSDGTNQTDLNLTDNLVNTTLTVQTVTYHFTPHIDPGDGDSECGGGVDTTITVYINPRPRIEVTADDTLCYDGSTSFTLVNPTNQTGEWRYDLDVTYPAGVTGTLSDGTNQTDLNLTDNLANATLLVQTVTYHFTPHIDPGDGQGECGGGMDTTITVYVNPRPRIEVAVDDTLCYDGTADITITNPTNQTGEWRYDLDVTYPAGVTGTLSDGTDQSALNLTDNLVNTTLLVQTVTYHFTPHIDPGDGQGECGGGVDTTITVYINPRPRIEVTADDTLCYDGSTSFTLVNPTNQTGEWRYDLDVTYPAGVTGTLSDGTNQTDLNLTDNLVNTTLLVQTVTYHFTPHIDPGDGQGECGGGADTTITVYINPRPRIEVAVDDTLCYDGTADITITNPTNQTGEWRYDLDVTYPAGVTGTLSDGTSQTDLNLTDNLANATLLVQTVTYHFTPHIDPGDGQGECGGGVDTTITVYINPRPRIEVAVDDTLCYDGTADITITNPTNQTGEWRYDLDVTYPVGVTGTLSDGTNQTDLNLTDNLVNTTLTVQTVTYHFTPHIDPGDGQGECGGGVDTTITVYINPRPRIEVTADDTLCYDGSTSFTLVNPTNQTGEWRYDLDVTYPAGVTGTLSDGTNQTALNLTDNLVNTTLLVQTVTYHFTPHIDPGDGDSECGGGVDTTITVYINPRPRIEVAVDDTLCYDGTADITITNPTNQTGEWRYDLDVTYPAGVTGTLSDGTNQTDLNLTDNLVNTTLTVQTVTYHFTPHIDPGDGQGECGGGVDTTITVYINPRPRIEVAVDDTLCYDGTADITITNPTNQTGEWRYDLDVTYPAGVTGTLSDGTNQTALNLTDNLVNTTLLVQTVTYHFTPHIDPGDGQGECGGGVDTTITVYINPRPRIEVTADDTLCYDGSTQLHPGKSDEPDGSVAL